MIKKYIHIVATFLFVGSVFAQTTESFETETDNSVSFTDESQIFNITTQAGGTFDIANYTETGWNGSTVDNKYIDNSGSADIGVPVQFTIKSDGASPFNLKSIYLLLKQSDLNPGSGSCTITGKLNNSTVFTATSNTGFNADPLVNNGYTLIDLATYGGVDNSNIAIDEYIVSTTGTFEYVALDAMKWNQDCTTLVLPTASSQTFYNAATVANLVATGNGLKWYADSSGGSPLDETTALATGTYYVTSSNDYCESTRVAVAVNIGNITTWNGTSWDNGSPTPTSKAIISGNYSEEENVIASTLEINELAIVSVPTGFNFTISGAIIVAPTASLTFESNSNLIQQGTTNINSGDITIKRDSSPLFRSDYTLWSSPVENQKLFDFSPLTVSTRFYTYNTTTDQYNSVADPSLTNFALANSYLIRTPNTWVSYPGTPASWTGIFTGKPNNGNITYTMSTVGSGYNAVGNPYPSTLNIDNFIDNNTLPLADNIDGTLYFWRKTNDANNPISYTTLTKAGVVSGNPHPYLNDNYISVGQGFIVKANSTTLNFTNAMRTANNQNQFFRTKATERNRIWLNLSKGTTPVNQMMVAYMTGATDGIDVAIDGRYMNDSPTALNSLINDEEFAIQGRSLPFTPSDIVPLAFNATSAGNYTIAIDHLDGLFSGNQDVILVDNTTGIETDLKKSSYTFQANIGVDKNRFALKYQKTLGINTSEFNENNILVSKDKSTIQIKSNTTLIENVKVFSIEGRLLLEKKQVNANGLVIESSKFANQILIIKITSVDKKVVNKKVIN